MGGDSWAAPVSDAYIHRRYFPGARPGRRFKRISVFSRRRRRYICLQLPACLVIALPTATLFFSVQTFTRQTSCRNRQIRVSKNCAKHSTVKPFQGGEIHLHPSCRYGWSILSRIQITISPSSLRGLSGASALTLARPMAARVSSKRAGSSDVTESSRLSQSFISPRISSRIAVRSRTSVSSSSSFAAASSRT